MYSNVGEQHRDHWTSFNAKVSVHGFGYLGVLGGGAWVLEGYLGVLGGCLSTLGYSS